MIVSLWERAGTAATFEVMDLVSNDHSLWYLSPKYCTRHIFPVKQHKFVLFVLIWLHHRQASFICWVQQRESRKIKAILDSVNQRKRFECHQNYPSQKKMRIAYDCRSFCQSPSREQPSNICHLTLGGTTDCLISISVYTFSNLQLLVNCSAGFVAVTLWPPRCGLYCQCSSFFTVLCCFPLC